MYGLRLLRKPSVQRVALGLVVAIVLVYRLGQFLVWLREPVWSYDFAAYWAAARHLLDGVSIYTPEQLSGPFVLGPADLYQYPPALAAFLVPFAAVLPFGAATANWLWVAAGAAILTTSVLALARHERLEERFPLLRGRGRWWLVAALIAFPPVIDELVVGNVNALLTGLFAATWLALARRDPRGDAIAAVAIGLATVLKLFPALLILWLLLVGRPRAAAWSIVAALAVAAATLPITGLQPWLDYVSVARNLSINLAQPDALAPTFWLTPYLGFTVARILVTVVGLAVLVWTARSLDARRSFAIAILVSILVTPTLYGSYLTVTVVPMLLGLAAGISLLPIAIAYLAMWGGEQEALGDLGWIVRRALPTAGALLLLAAAAGVRAVRPRTPVGVEGDLPAG